MRRGIASVKAGVRIRHAAPLPEVQRYYLPDWEAAPARSAHRSQFRRVRRFGCLDLPCRRILQRPKLCYGTRACVCRFRAFHKEMTMEEFMMLAVRMEMMWRQHG
jgi:hypothetical protein